MPPDRPLVRATLRTSVVLGTRVVVQAGTLLLLAHLLGPADYGSLAGLASLAVVMGTLATFGTHFLLLAEGARDGRGVQNVLSHALPTTLICGSALFTIYLAICWLIHSESPTSFLVAMSVGAAELILQPLLSLVAMTVMAQDRTALSQIIYTVPLTLRMFAAAVLIVVQPEAALLTFASAYFLAGAASLAVGLALSSTKWPSIYQWKLPRRHELRRSAGYAASAVTAMGPGELDKTLSTLLLPPVANGVYAAATRVIGATTLPVTALTLSALPRLLRENSASTRSSGSHLARWVFCSAFAYGIILAMGLWVAAPVVNLLFGDQYDGITDVIQLLAFAAPGMCLRIAAGSTLLALEKPWMRVGFEISGLSLLAATSIVLTRGFGPAGMPMALIASEWTMALVGAGCVYRAIHHRTSES